MEEKRSAWKLDEAKKLDLAISIIDRIMTRYQHVKDPATRHMLFVDKFCILLDTVIGMLDSQPIDDASDDSFDGKELRVKAKKLASDLQSEMAMLLEWIQTSMEKTSK